MGLEGKVGRSHATSNQSTQPSYTGSRGPSSQSTHILQEAIRQRGVRTWKVCLPWPRPSAIWTNVPLEPSQIHCEFPNPAPLSTLLLCRSSVLLRVQPCPPLTSCFRVRLLFSYPSVPHRCSAPIRRNSVWAGRCLMRPRAQSIACSKC